MEEGIDEDGTAKGLSWDSLFCPHKQQSHTTSANLFLLDPHLSSHRPEKMPSRNTRSLEQIQSRRSQAGLTREGPAALKVQRGAHCKSRSRVSLSAATLSSHLRPHFSRETHPPRAPYICGRQEALASCKRQPLARSTSSPSARLQLWNALVPAIPVCHQPVPDFVLFTLRCLLSRSRGVDQGC